MSVLTYVRNWWYARQRKIDLEILWPACKEQADTLDQAKAAFAMHAYNDKAWQTIDDIYSFIDNLK